MSYGYDVSFSTVYRTTKNGQVVYYKTWDNAVAGYDAATITRQPVVIIDDVIYVATPITLLDDVRARALNKLTEEEKVALGVK